MNQVETIVRVTLRLPQDTVVYLDKQARGNLTSRNAEILRSIRKCMATTETKKGEATA